MLALPGNEQVRSINPLVAEPTCFRRSRTPGMDPWRKARYVTATGQFSDTSPIQNKFLFFDVSTSYLRRNSSLPSLPTRKTASVPERQVVVPEIPPPLPAPIASFTF